MNVQDGKYDGEGPKDLSDTRLFPEFLCPAQSGNFWVPPRGEPVFMFVCMHCIVNLSVRVLWVQGGIVSEDAGSALEHCPLLFKEPRERWEKRR